MSITQIIEKASEIQAQASRAKRAFLSGEMPEDKQRARRAAVARVANARAAVDAQRDTLVTLVASKVEMFERLGAEALHIGAKQRARLQRRVDEIAAAQSAAEERLKALGAILAERQRALRALSK